MTIVVSKNASMEELQLLISQIQEMALDKVEADFQMKKKKRQELRKKLMGAIDLQGKTPLELQRERRDE